MREATAFKFPLSYDALTESQLGALQRTKEAVMKAEKGKPGSIIAQVFFDKDGEDITVKGCFIEHEYASRINDILIERNKALGIKK